MNHFSLGSLADPNHVYPYTASSAIDNDSQADLLQFLRMMLLIRTVEQKLAVGKKAGIVKGPVHLGIGQEAIATGVAAELTKVDRVFGAHRSHSHVLAMGCSLTAFFAEILARKPGLSSGMGGSMHLADPKQGFFGSVPIVAGTVPLAVGAGLAAKLEKSSAIGVVYFGDGAIEEGVVHESLNLASLLKVPVLFVVENNLFASHMHITQRQPYNRIARFGEAHGIQSKVVDGNNVLAVQQAAKELIEAARAGDGPGLLEAVTYRWLGHVDWRADIDVGVNRSEQEVADWKKRDPIAGLVKVLFEAGQVTAEAELALREAIQAEVDSAWEVALAYPAPTTAEGNSYLYSPVDSSTGEGKV